MATTEKGMIVTNKAFVSKELTQYTLKVDKLNENIKSHLFEIAHIFSEVKAKNLLENEEFKNIAEWAKECFGYEKSMTYNLIKIGQEYTIPVLNEKGKTVGYRSNLILEGEDYNTTQICKMLPAGHDIAKELSDNGVIAPSMSAKEIEIAIKNATAPETLEEETDITDEIEENAKEEENVVIDQIVEIDTDLFYDLCDYLKTRKDKRATELLNRLNELK